MKRIYFSLVLLIMVGSITSCKKFLNTEPLAFAAPENNYASGGQLLQALAGVYDVLGYQRAGLYADNLFSKLGATTDEGFYARASGLPLCAAYTFDYTEPIIDDTWKALYVGIERANNLIYYINTPKSMDAAERNAILGEAEFMRGYYYFLLVSNYGDVPMRLEPTTITGATTNNVARTPAKDVYAQILKDMTDAEAKCYPATKFGYSSRVSKTTVQGILARVCLTMAGYPLQDNSKYADAVTWAAKVQASGIHSLNPSYSQIFINEAQDIYDIKEAMWEADFNGNDITTTLETGRLGNTNGISTTNIDTGYSYAFVNVTKTLYNLYGAGDLRRDWTIAPFGYGGTPLDKQFKGNVIYDRNCGKWRRSYELLTPKSKNNTGQNFPILRYSDVLLMLAEADNQANSGPSVNAYNAINQVRRRGYGLNPNSPAVSVSVVSGLTVTNAGSGYLNTMLTPLTFSGGGGTGATGVVNFTAGKIAGITVLNPGTGYTTAPTVTIGTAWTAATIYSVGTQVYNGNNLYTVTVAGTSTSTAPTQTSGSSSAAITGAVFTYAGVKAIITATIGTSIVDLTGLNKTQFQQAIQDERARELCFETQRRPDLIRWGIWTQTMSALSNQIITDLGANALKYAAVPAANAASSPKFLLYPIPASEINVNKAATQNPGY